MRAIAICAVLAGCGQAATGPLGPPAGGDGQPAGGEPTFVPHGPRLGDEATPISYDVRLELDPERETFAGRVAIAIDVAPETQVIWLHAVELELHATAVIGDAAPVPVATADGPIGTQLVGFRLPAPATGRVTLTIDYTGHVRDMSSAFGKSEEGLFRERAGGRWYLYSQAESVFARKIVPCFDEPRWKPAWRVTAVVPRGQVVLANAAQASERNLPDGRREVRFAEVAQLASYLFAITVGPFAVIDAGRVGRGKLPLRLAVQPADARRVREVGGEIAKIVAALEAYVDAPLPLTKLDLVVVPTFFGAMENPGLITFSRAVLVGGRERTMIAAHELAHQWFGDAVTPAWWDDLWLAEGFATWLGQRIASELGAGGSVLDHHDARAAALAVDARLDARPIIHPVETSDEVEPMFDAIGYEKAADVIGSFEQLVGRDAFRAALRDYLARNAGRAVTSQALFDALAAATRPEVAEALAANLRHAGTPSVSVGLTCAADPGGAGELTVFSHDGIAVPVCVRYPTRPGARARTRICVLAGEATRHPLAVEAGCPRWHVDNDGGHGYYRTMQIGPPFGVVPIGELSSDERLARGDDHALSLLHGELKLSVALDEIAALAATREPYAELAALTIARMIDTLIDDPERAAWAAWLAARFAHRLTADALSDPPRPAGAAVRDQIVELARGAVPAAALGRAATGLAHHPISDLSLILWVDTSNADALLDRVLKAAGDSHQADEQHALFASIGAFPGRFAPRVVDILLSRRFVADDVWQALVAMMSRSESRTAAWRAIHDHLEAVLRVFPAAQLPRAIAAMGALCDPVARDALAAELPVLVAKLHAPEPDATRSLQRATASISRCVDRRLSFGDVAHTLAAAGASTPRP